jgi:hypothetical protein
MAKLPSVYDRKSFLAFTAMGTSTSTSKAERADTPQHSTPPIRSEKKNMDFYGVGWNDEHDPENPMNWPKWKKSLNFSVVFLICFVR